MNFIRRKNKKTFKLPNALWIKLLTPLRVGLSVLKEHNFKHKPFRSCGNSIEFTIHFFLQYANYTFQRLTLLNKMHSIDPNDLAQEETSGVRKCYHLDNQILKKLLSLSLASFFRQSVLIVLYIQFDLFHYEALQYCLFLSSLYLLFLLPLI